MSGEAPIGDGAIGDMIFGPELSTFGSAGTQRILYARTEDRTIYAELRVIYAQTERRTISARAE